MRLPDLNRLVEAHIPVTAADFDGYVAQMRRDLLPPLRRLQADGHLAWFSFLLHPAGQLAGHDASDTSLVIHLRLEPAARMDVDAFIALLPQHFLEPLSVPVSAISALDRSLLRDQDWAHGWKIAGDASEWVLCLLEGHDAAIPVGQVVQFLHFITNPLMLGYRCLCIPAGFLSF